MGEEDRQYPPTSFEYVTQRDKWAVVTHGRRGGDGGNGPPLASKNRSPPLEPKNRDFQKYSGQEKGKIYIFENIFFNVCGFLSEEMALMLLKNLAFLSHVFT